MLEQECKKIIPASEYSRLCHLIKWDTEYTQINFYYDTNDFKLALAGITLRVREKDSKLLLEAKLPDETNSKVSRIREEKAFSIKEIPGKIAIPDNPELNFLPHGLYNLKGNLITYRKKCSIGNNAYLFLDKNIYFDCIDYELELEYENDLETILDFLKYADIKFSEIAVGKYTRFINYLKAYDRMIELKSKHL